MTGQAALRLAARVLVLVVLAASGSYFILYLYRWEWTRAIIAGVFFVAAEVVLVAMVLGHQIARLGERVGRLELADGSVARQISAANAGRRPRTFDWLRDITDTTPVFIPVLMGAGVILSAIAYAVERVAGALAGPVVDRASARRLALDLPLGTTDVAPVAPAVALRPAVTHRAFAVVGWLLALGVAALLAVAAVDALRDMTESRAESSEGAATAVTLRIEQRAPVRPVTEVTEALAVSCRHRLSSGTEIVAIQPAGPAEVDVLLEPGLGELRRRRYFGCLEDGTLDRVRAKVVAYEVLDEPVS